MLPFSPHHSPLPSPLVTVGFRNRELSLAMSHCRWDSVSGRAPHTPSQGLAAKPGCFEVFILGHSFLSIFKPVCHPIANTYFSLWSWERFGGPSWAHGEGEAEGVSQQNSVDNSYLPQSPIPSLHCLWNLASVRGGIADTNRKEEKVGLCPKTISQGAPVPTGPSNDYFSSVIAAPVRDLQDVIIVTLNTKATKGKCETAVR